MNKYLAPLRIGTDAVTLAVNIAGLQLYDMSVVPEAAFHQRFQLSKERVKIAIVNFPSVSFKAEAGGGGNRYLMLIIKDALW